MPSRLCTLFPYTTLFRSIRRISRLSSRLYLNAVGLNLVVQRLAADAEAFSSFEFVAASLLQHLYYRISLDALKQRKISILRLLDRKSTRLNSSHLGISYAVSFVYSLSLHDALPIYSANIQVVFQIIPQCRRP